MKTVSQLLMEGATDEKKSKENFLKVVQLETDNIISAIVPHSAAEIGFIVFSLEQALEVMKSTMKRYPRQEITYCILNELIGTKSVSVEVPERAKDDK